MDIFDPFQNHNYEEQNKKVLIKISRAQLEFFTESVKPGRK